MDQISINGQLFDLPVRGPAGPDGNPIGTVISFMGTKAPYGYLVCDGSTYTINQYPALAMFFKDQFGKADYFGSEGEGTFKVPDMRNLFLRGYHGEADEQLSGNIGEKQEATEHPYVYSGTSIVVNHQVSPINEDYVNKQNMPSTAIYAYTGTTYESHPYLYTSRPINMAVLYCIKAYKPEDTYSDEEICIGTWLGKPLYRKCIESVTPGAAGWNTLLTIPGGMNVEKMIQIYGYLVRGSTSVSSCFTSYPSYEMNMNYNVIPGSADRIDIWLVNNSICNLPLMVIMEYTKTTD